LKSKDKSSSLLTLSSRYPPTIEHMSTTWSVTTWSATTALLFRLASTTVVASSHKAKSTSPGDVVAQLGMWWLSGDVVAQLAKARLGEKDCNTAVPGSIPASSTVS
jgi:hypothetical protein